MILVALLESRQDEFQALSRLGEQSLIFTRSRLALDRDLPVFWLGVSHKTSDWRLLATGMNAVIGSRHHAEDEFGTY